MTVTHPRSKLRAAPPPLSRKQRRTLARSCGTKTRPAPRVTLLEGSVRSGKTFVTLLRWFTFVAVDAPKGGALVMVGKSRDAIWRNIFEPLENDPALAVFAPFISYKQGAPTARLFGRVVHIVGAADAKAETKVRGMTVAGAYIDELTTIPQEFFKQMLARMSVDGAQLFATTNPDAPTHWLKADYLDRRGELPDWYIEHFTMDDNPGLSDSYKESLKREYTGLWYRRFINGEWVAAEGAVYPEFDPELHVVKQQDMPPIERVFVAGLDYGTNHRTRAYLLGMGTIHVSAVDGRRVDAAQIDARAMKALFVLDEFRPGTSTVGKHAKEFERWMREQPHELWRHPEWLVVDPAAAVFKQQLFDDGHSNVLNAHNAVVPGIQTVSSLFAAGRLFISDTCVELVKMLPGYRWDPKATERGDTKPIKEGDDEADALRYAIYTSRRYWRSHIPLAAAMNDTSHEPESDAAG